METHLLTGEGVIKMAPSLFTSGVRPRHKVSKRNFNSGPDLGCKVNLCIIC